MLGYMSVQDDFVVHGAYRQSVTLTCAICNSVQLFIEWTQTEARTLYLPRKKAIRTVSLQHRDHL